MKSTFSGIVFAIVCIGLAAAPVSAQFANADLAGVVTDTDGGALPGVTVTAVNTGTAQTRVAVTSGNGTYSINGLRPGPYTLRYELDGFQSVEQTDVELRVGQEARFNVTLELGTVEEFITVTSVTPLVEMTSKEVGGTLTADDIEALPTQNRSALLFAALMPGVIPSASTESTASDALFINGQDDNNNSFNFDGANNDDDVIGARAGAQARVPMEAIQEFQVLTTQFDAEFGRALGGVLNAVTKSGTNQFSGTAFALFQNSDWNDKNFFLERSGAEQPQDEFRTIGFTLGGPIIRDKFHFFVSREENLDEEGVFGNFPARPELDFTTTEDNDIENTMIKLDAQPSQSHHLAYRYLLETSPQFNQIIGDVTLAAAREEDDTDSNWTLSFESVANTNSFNTARVSFTKEDVSFANPGFNGGGGNFESQRGQSVSEAHPGFTDGASTVAQSRFNRSTQLDDTFSYFVPEAKGEHEFRVGFQYSEREEEFTNFGTLNGQFFGFDDDFAFDPNDISTFPGAFSLRVLGGLTADIPKNDTLGVFLQDDWRVSENLTLTLGLRYDEEDITDDETIAPRIGFTWDPLGQGKTVVRGGFGRFYDRFQLGFFAGFFLDAVDLPQGFILRFPDSGLDPQLFFDIVQQNGITNLDQLRGFLANQLEGGAIAPINRFPTVDNPDRKQAYADTISIGVEHEFRPGWAAGVDLIRTKNEDVLLTADLNDSSAALGGRPNISILNGQPVPSNMGSITTYFNGAESEYNAFQLSVRKRGRRLSGRFSYTFADSEGTHEGGGGGTSFARFQVGTVSGYNFDTGEFLGQPVNLGLDDPRTNDIPVNWHRNHNLVFSGTYMVPGTSWRDNGGLSLAWIYRFMSGAQTTLFSATEFLDNGNRAPLEQGTFDSAQPGSGIDANGVHNSGRLMGAEEPSLKRLDISLRYNIPLGGDRELSLVGDVFNVFDSVNFDDLGSTLVSSGSFLTYDTAFNPREFQLGLRFEF